MELFVADLVERFYTALWPFLRIGAMLLAVPILSIDAVTVRIRVLLTLMLTFLIYPLVEWPIIDPVSAAGLSEIINQILIGVLMGLFLQMVTAAVVLGGQAIANAMGLSMATMVDPGLGNVPLVSQFLLILATSFCRLAGTCSSSVFCCGVLRPSLWGSHSCRRPILPT
jgi:flagellar biosynthesis protein FliR